MRSLSHDNVKIIVLVMFVIITILALWSGKSYYNCVEDCETEYQDQFDLLICEQRCEVKYGGDY